MQVSEPASVKSSPVASCVSTAVEPSVSAVLKVKTSGIAGLAVPMFTFPKFPVTVWAERTLQEAHNIRARTAHRPTSLLRLGVRLVGLLDPTIETGSQNVRVATIMICFSLEEN
jgi:hypothetical protein